MVHGLLSGVALRIVFGGLVLYYSFQEFNVFLEIYSYALLEIISAVYWSEEFLAYLNKLHRFATYAL